MRAVWMPLLLGLTTFAISAGCSSSTTSRAGPYVKPGLVMVPADQMRFYGLASATAESSPPAGLPATDTRTVQTDTVVTAIQFNRYADPARPDTLMHEAHIVYRRDAGSRWRLNPPTAEQQILVGPQLTDGRGEIKGLAAPELDAYLHEQRNTLHRQEETLAKLTSTLQQLAVQQKQLAEQVAHGEAVRHEDTPPEHAAEVIPRPATPLRAAPIPREKTAAEIDKEPPVEMPER